ncbi:MAG: sodium:calcium antiporter, partial [Asgard group archaeon]|nr:sodium:calcium antiporter [Asgard group archaeon]
IKSIEDLMDRTNLSETSIGFALLSVITSIPELTVAIFAIIEGSPSLSVGDLLGSNVFNIGIVVGVLMLTSGFLKECPAGLDELADILILSSLIPLILVVLRIPEFLLAIGLLIIFILTAYRETRTQKIEGGIDVEKGKHRLSIIILKILLGAVIVIISARFTVSSALDISSIFMVNPIVVGALIVAFGTSLPELSLSLIAIKRGRTNLAYANAIGSNLTNLTLILGLVLFSSVFGSFRLDVTKFLEIISFVLITSLIVWYHITKFANCKIVGASLILTYILFLINTLFR